MNPHNTTSPISISTSRQWVVTVTAVVVVALAIAGGVFLTNREAGRQASASPIPAAHVAIMANGLDIADLQVKKGQAVTWQNQDTAEHRLALSSGMEQAPGFGGNMRLEAGQNYTYIFDTPGVYHYYDALQPLRMTGTITVIK